MTQESLGGKKKADELLPVRTLLLLLWLFHHYNDQYI